MTGTNLTLGALASQKNPTPIKARDFKISTSSPDYQEASALCAPISGASGFTSGPK
ncbi:MAG: hypothetical protein ACI8QF_000847 [Limisphaerales bacterium]|jgi:hypothetical protein